jgi:predicted dehydrogenase
MAAKPLRIGLIGVGANMRARHVPGFLAIPDVEIVAICNRRPGSTAQAARELGITRTYEHWQELVASAEVDAVVIGTWPYLHCPITLAALETGKHVLTEARMALNAAEAHRMLQASRRHANLITQIVPSPYGLRGHHLVRDLVQGGFLGELREIYVYSLGNSLADPVAPLSWRQDAALSGFNMLDLGILHETLLRWVPPVARVMAQVHAFVPTRIDPESRVHRTVGTPDSVQVIGKLADGTRVLYHLSGVAPFPMGTGIKFYGREGIVVYDLVEDKIHGARLAGGQTPALEELAVPAAQAREWTVEADFVSAIREGKAIELTSFESGVRYMEFTEAVARSAQRGAAVDLPLEEYLED